MKRLITGIALAVLLSVPALVVSAATLVVHPGDTDEWALTATSTSAAGFVDGPATPPLGDGSVSLSVGADGSGAAQARNADYQGVALADLTELSYSTYVDQDGSGGQAPYIILQLDHDGGGTVDDLLFFEPVYQTAAFFPANPQPALTLDTWQAWDALAGGWWSVNGIAGAGPGVNVKSIADYLAAEPDATVINSSTGAGGVRIVAGFGAGAWDNFAGNVDAVTIGVNGVDTTYDFELTPPHDCQFAVSGTTMTLLADCTTTVTIFVPDGFTLDGDGYSITAVDPASGTFTGAVVRNAGDEAHVINLTVRAEGLAIVCHASSPVDLRLRGILFDGASGSITYSTVDDINQGASGCQEGNAIEVRNAPFDGTHPNTQTVKIAHNVVTDYQKGGIIANGDVDVSIHHNHVGQSATQANLAANAVQIAFGGGGEIVHNQIGGNSWCCESAAATAVLLFDTASGVVVSKNNIGGNADIGIYISTDDAIVDNNKVFESGADGFYDIGIGNYGDGSSVTNNKVGGYDTPYDGVSGGNNKAVPSS